MAQQATIQVRIDTRVKSDARKVLEKAGLDLSSGVKLFLHNVAKTKSVPLDLRTENGYTVAQEQEMLRNIAEAEKTEKYYTSGKELLASIK